MRSAAYNNRVLGPERQAPIGEGYEPAAELTTSVRRVCGRARVKCRPIVPTTALDPYRLFVTAESSRSITFASAAGELSDATRSRCSKGPALLGQSLSSNSLLPPILGLATIQKDSQIQHAKTSFLSEVSPVGNCDAVHLEHVVQSSTVDRVCHGAIEPVPLEVASRVPDR